MWIKVVENRMAQCLLVMIYWKYVDLSSTEFCCVQENTLTCRFLKKIDFANKNLCANLNYVL